MLLNLSSLIFSGLCVLLMENIYAAPLACQKEISQTTSSIGLSTVINPANAADKSTTTYSCLVSLSGYAQQRLIFSSTGNEGDSVKIKISFPVAIHNPMLLENVEVASYNGTSYNGDRTPITSSSVNLSWSNLKEVLVSFVPNSTFDGVELRISGEASVAVKEVRIHYVYKPMPAPSDSPGHSMQLEIKSVLPFNEATNPIVFGKEDKKNFRVKTQKVPMNYSQFFINNTIFVRQPKVSFILHGQFRMPADIRVIAGSKNHTSVKSGIFH